MNADLQLFVRESLGRGIPRTTISDTLRKAGWRSEEIEAVLAGYADLEFPLPVPRRRPYVSAREAFLYLVLFATLYITAYNVGVVLFRAVDLALPDPTRRWESARFAVDAARGATAGLVIAFPIFLALSRVIGRGIEQEPEKRGSRIRKWLTYLTLFVAAMVIIGDLTFLVSRLLSGELPARIALKALVVLAIAGAVFGHYLGELRRDEREGPPPARENRLGPRVLGAAVLGVAVLGLLVSGSPRRERDRQLDARRIEDLRSISRRITIWTWEHRRLPGTLEELASDPETVVPMADPLTRAPYEYRAVDSLRYELCASFATTDSLAPAGDPAEASRFWRHTPGRVCFLLSVPERTLKDDTRPVERVPRP